MRLIRQKEDWNPFPELGELSNRLNQMLGMKRWGGNGEMEALALNEWAPSCNISETDDGYRVTAELPGVDKKNVHITLDDNVLCIRGERREEKEEKDAKVHRRELSYGSFLRRFTMPENADPEKVSAHFKDGLLDVEIGKSPATPKKTEREIRID